MAAASDTALEASAGEPTSPVSQRCDQMEASAGEPTTPVSQRCDQAEASAGEPTSPVSQRCDQTWRPESVVGKALGAAVGSPSAHKGISACTLDVSYRIAQRYREDVRAAEQARLKRHVPLHKELVVSANEMEMIRGVKSDLDEVMVKFSRSGKDGVGQGWDDVIGNNVFQKKLQYMIDRSRTGHFIEEYSSRGRYEGDFLYGMRHGKGVHGFQGDHYEGEWKWDNRHGWGVLTMSDGSMIKGNWENGKPHGFTSIADKEGNVVYEGEFKAGKREGLGRQIFQSGDMYDGGWEEGRLHDRGIYYFKNGDKLIGQWKRGLYDGVGVFHFVDGSISRRTYQDGILLSSQDYDLATQRFGKTLNRKDMQKHTADTGFPRDIFIKTW